MRYQTIARIARKRTILVAAALSSTLAACSGPIETRAGLHGMVIPADASIVVVASHEQNGRLADSATQAVAEILAKQGRTVAETGAVRVVVGLAERPASLEILSDSGVLSKAKRHRFLQDCADSIQRLTLAAETPDGRVSHAWAEEDHCHGKLEESLHSLAAQAVAQLVTNGRTGQAFRFGTD